VRLGEAHVGGLRALRGGDGPPLVHLHGAAGLHADPALELLADDFDVLALELPGFGRSPAPRTFDEAAVVVLDALAEAGIETCALAGISFGAVVALHAGLAAPERVEALVLLAPAALRPAGWRPPAPEELPRALFVRPDREGLPAPARPEDGAFVAALLDGLDQEALRARLPALPTPTLVAFGTEDGLFPPELGSDYRALIPGCSFVLVWDAAHELGWDRPDAVAALVGDFVLRHEAFAVGTTG
jgi:pimeloyl-ACP methyl ester carboxylesterase